MNEQERKAMENRGADPQAQQEEEQLRNLDDEGFQELLETMWD